MSLLSKWLFSEPSSMFNPAKVLSKSIDSIPSGALLRVHGKNFVGFGIRYFEDMDGNAPAWDNHEAIYFGSGAHEVLEELPQGLVRDKFEDSMTADCAFQVWVYRPMTIAQLQTMKAFIYPKIGSKYGWLNIARLAVMDWLRIFRRHG